MSGSTTQLTIGYVTKPHGLKGDVLVHLVTNRVSERMRVGSSFVTDRGPLTIESCSPQGDRWRVRFAEVHDRNGAESIARLELRAEPLVVPDALWVHEMVGSEVRLPDGTVVGRVRELESNPASDLLVLESGVLVPLVFVVSTLAGTAGFGGVVVIDPPDGLLDLNQPEVSDPDRTPGE